MQLINADSLEYLKTLDPCSIDAVVTDPPYGLSSNKGVSDTLQKWLDEDRAYIPKGKGFMGKEWDSFVPPPALWDEVYRVLKEGGHALVFASSRTQDLMGLSLRLAGFEIRDCIQWIYGGGFPKAQYIKIGGQWEGWGTVLKPAYEPVLLVRKPFKGTVSQNVLKQGVGAINIDVCRIETDDDLTRVANPHTGFGTFRFNRRKEKKESHPLGRWPANVILDEDVECGEWKRFFYCPKASKKEREGNTHPTVKPIELMRYLCRLITPPDGIVLDPFMGSGTTGVASCLEGFNFLGIEREENFFDIAKRRIEQSCG